MDAYLYNLSFLHLVDPGEKIHVGLHSQYEEGNGIKGRSIKYAPPWRPCMTSEGEGIFWCSQWMGVKEAVEETLILPSPPVGC